MRYWSKVEGKWIEVSEYEFYRQAIKDFDKVVQISTICQECLKFFTDGKEIARAVGDVKEMPNYLPQKTW